jgi:hypothetical protein
MVQKISLGQQVAGSRQVQKTELSGQRAWSRIHGDFLVGAAFSRDSNNFNDLNDFDRLSELAPLTVHGSPLSQHANHFAQPVSSYLAS